MSLPKFQTQDPVAATDFGLLQTTWAALIDPIINRAQNKSNVLQNVALINGITVVNHLLGKKMQGWIISDIQGAATIYRSAPLNDQTLTLTSSAAVTVNIEVF